MSKWMGWIYKFCHEVWSEVRPYLVEVSVHFVIFCLTLVLILSILIISWSALAVCEYFFYQVPIIIVIIVYVSDAIILVHFIRRLLDFPWPITSFRGATWPEVTE